MDVEKWKGKDSYSKNTLIYGIHEKEMEMAISLTIAIDFFFSSHLDMNNITGYGAQRAGKLWAMHSQVGAKTPIHKVDVVCFVCG